MKEAYWGYWIVLLGAFVFIIMLLIQNITTSTTEDDYLIKQISEAAMVDAVDYAYYREYGELKINKEKFKESFLRRFAEIASLTGDYEITFVAVYEAPPKASIEIVSSTGNYMINTDSQNFDITTRQDFILELNS